MHALINANHNANIGADANTPGFITVLPGDPPLIRGTPYLIVSKQHITDQSVCALYHYNDVVFISRTVDAVLAHNRPVTVAYFNSIFRHSKYGLTEYTHSKEYIKAIKRGDSPESMARNADEPFFAHYAYYKDEIHSIFVTAAKCKRVEALSNRCRKCPYFHKKFECSLRIYLDRNINSPGTPMRPPNDVNQPPRNKYKLVKAHTALTPGQIEFDYCNIIPQQSRHANLYDTVVDNIQYASELATRANITRRFNTLCKTKCVNTNCNERGANCITSPTQKHRGPYTPKMIDKIIEKYTSRNGVDFKFIQQVFYALLTSPIWCVPSNTIFRKKMRLLSMTADLKNTVWGFKNGERRIYGPADTRTLINVAHDFTSTRPFVLPARNKLDSTYNEFKEMNPPYLTLTLIRAIVQFIITADSNDCTSTLRNGNNIKLCVPTYPPTTSSSSQYAEKFPRESTTTLLNHIATKFNILLPINIRYQGQINTPPLSQTASKDGALNFDHPDVLRAMRTTMGQIEPTSTPAIKYMLDVLIAEGTLQPTLPQFDKTGRPIKTLKSARRKQDKRQKKHQLMLFK